MQPRETLSDAVKYPWADGDAGVTLVVGGILTLLSPLLVPGVFVVGYGLRVVEATMDGREHPPGFGDPGALLATGLRGTVVLLAYVALPLLVGFAAVVAVGTAVGRPMPGDVFVPLRRGLFSGGLLFVLVFLLAGLVLVVAYLAPAALVHLGRTRRLGAAFAFGDVRRLAGADSYGAAWLLALAVFAAAGVVLAVLNAAAIGVVVSGFVTFYAFVAMAHLYASGAGAAGFEIDAPTAE
ncbi:MAG: DUF4013 domain-containing protein [Halobacteriales archaeon]